MIGFTFDPKRCQHFVDALNSRGMIKPGAAGWTGNEMITLAGACLAGAISQGPFAWGLAATDVRHQEHAEAQEESFTAELHAAIGAASNFSFDVVDGTFGDQYGPTVKVVARMTDDGVTFTIVEGTKG